MNDEAMKKWIDGASYEELLHRWRFAELFSPWFQGDVGAYFSKVMFEKRDADVAEAIAASKRIGW